MAKRHDKTENNQGAFGVSYVLDDLAADRAHAFLELFVEHAIAANGLECRASHHDLEWDFRVASKTGPPTAAQRAAVRNWLSLRKEVARFVVEDSA